MRIFTFLFLLVLLSSCNTKTRNSSINGPIFGTSYNFVFEGDLPPLIQNDIDSLFTVINSSMSTYMTDSDISRINRNESHSVDQHFINVFNISSRIYNETQGVFDPTIGAIVNAWRFGPEASNEKVTSVIIDSLLEGVGFEKLKIEGNQLYKSSPSTYIDFNSVAKGYAVDVIADYFSSKGISNYLIEIGGELKASGMNAEKNQPWIVGIEAPNFDGTQSIVKAIALEASAMATSGTYRKYKVDELGNKYAHIIDTKTGHPSKSNILSVSVITEDCADADAYATAFQSMGIERLRAFLKNHTAIKAYVIYQNNNQSTAVESFNGFPE